MLYKRVPRYILTKKKKTFRFGCTLNLYVKNPSSFENVKMLELTTERVKKTPRRLLGKLSVWCPSWSTAQVFTLLHGLSNCNLARISLGLVNVVKAKSM